MYFGFVQFERVRLLGQLEGFHLDFAGLQLLVLHAFGRLVQFGLGLLGVTHLGSISVALGLDVAQLYSCGLLRQLSWHRFHLGLAEYLW